jgi:hypothetical protein
MSLLDFAGLLASPVDHKKKGHRSGLAIDSEAFFGVRCGIILDPIENDGSGGRK